MKKRTDKDELAGILEEVSEGLGFNINDLGYKAGIEPSYLAKYGPCNIQFFQPKPSRNSPKSA